MKTSRLFISIQIVVLLLFPSLGQANEPTQQLFGDAVIPGVLRTHSSFHHIGVLWEIEGDDDLDSSMTLEYRKSGDTTWLPAAPAMRAYPTIYVHDGPLGLNSWGASALFLDPGNIYELQVSLTDPDGGGVTQVVIAALPDWPSPDPAGRHLYVVPGSGGGGGSPGNPFQGLQTAADAAQPGDIFHVASGTYAPFDLITSGADGRPITFMGPGDGTAVVDGGGISSGVVTLGRWDRTTGHIILQGLTIQNGSWGVDAQHTNNIYVHHNLIQDVDDGVINRRGDANEFNQFVCDNTILGRTSWPGSGIPGERGIDLRGDGNVACFNQVQNFGDCISLQPFTGPSTGNDVYGNDVSYCVDDGIEIDYNQANVRVWRNRVMNARMGVSVQPIYGGPAYIFRNEFFNLESVPVKMHNHTTGFYVVHNTGAKHSDGYGDNGAMWRNAMLRNNLFLGTRYAFEFTTVPDEGFRDFDYNGWGTSRVIGPGGPHFKWDNVRYDTIPDLPAGVEDHGVAVSFGDLMNATLPAGWDSPAPPGSRDLRLVPNSDAVNAGTLMENFNKPFVTDGQPDLGAFELGEPLPSYGPRLATPDFSASAKWASHPAPSTSDSITYTIQLQNSGAPITGTITLTDTIPLGLAYQTGTLTANVGMVDDASAPLLRWSGTTGAQTPVMIRYSVMVTETQTTALFNTADVIIEHWGSLELTSGIIVNGAALYLPVIQK